VKIAEVPVRSIITPSRLPASDYVVNPYVGCSHSCMYCYARFMRRFTGHSEKWGSFVDVKINATDVLPANLEKYRNTSVFFSSVTDPYLPVESKYRLTRGLLERLLPAQPEIGIQTKSALVLKDIDILRRFERCSVGLTITTLDDAVRKQIEPFTSSVAKRIDALKTLHESGIRTYAFIGPVFLQLTDWKAIIAAVRPHVDEVMFENLNLHGTIKQEVFAYIQTHHPDLLDAYRGIYAKGSMYWEDAEREIGDFCRREEVPHRIFFHHRASGKKASRTDSAR